MIVLAGEIAAATSSLALFEVTDDELHLLRTAQIANDEYPALAPVLRRFAAADRSRVRAACFLVTGAPPWPVESSVIRSAIGADVEVAETAPNDHRDPPTPLWSAARRAVNLAR